MTHSSSTSTPFINVNLNIQKSFTDDHLELFRELHPRKAFPHLYDPKNLPKSATFINHEKINMADVWPSDHGGLGKEDRRTFTQTARQVSNDQSSSIRDDINQNGYSLREEPVALRKLDENKSKKIKYQIIEGRTRLTHLHQLEVVNFIADVYEVGDDADVIRMAQMFNNQKKPFGQGKKNDILHTMRQLIEFKAIDFGGTELSEDLTAQDRQKVAGILRAEVKVLSSKLTEQQEDGIINTLIEDVTGAIWVRSWPSGNGVQSFIEAPVPHGLGLPETEDVKYVAVTGANYPMILGSIVSAINIHKPHQELRLLNYVGEPKADIPEESWRTQTVKFHKLFCEWEEKLAHIRYGGSLSGKYKISLYGAVPQIRSLHDKDGSWWKVHKYVDMPWEKKNGFRR